MIFAALKATGVLFFLLLAFLAYLQLSGNFHEVRKGELYRSAQPSADMLAAFSQEHGGKSVINLRGAAPGADWYEEELAATKQAGLEHFDFQMSATHHFEPAKAEALIALMKAAPKPLLIHCKSGADRTGFASMIYLMALTDVGEGQSERQLSVRYGHIGIPMLSQAWPMDESWEEFEQSIGLTGT
ncbi:tyrosine-protein phosphatase [Rhodalgimonas zhirmunskyi]|uniref:Tyrosine-protein phosphatase n=1 Tax=Rhodalgimonas zhirmunskyi TaxID=2964767 RepID=A0AAJ1UG34_9RHOB|nr:tyrosine-protein phosphatase [Rhodoalgimonas zhirmunskyi]MDQ2095441.1 tyrosine-protein phosphatase [Rhodoalgimonas zhirmunskyi]